MILSAPLAKALTFLPERLSGHIKDLIERSSLQENSINEIRIRAGYSASLSLDMKSHRIPYVCSKSEVSETLKKLCGNSMYAYAETIRNGFVNVEGGIRVGVCGKAVCEAGKISVVSEVSSINIRIPRSISGVCAPLLDCFQNTRGGILVFSPPGAGKTTLLRDFIVVAGSRLSLRVAVIDSRGELDNGTIPKSCLVDILSGYPMGAGIEIATRTLSPELIVCDEIGNGEEAGAVLCAQNAGVRLVASTHASSAEEVLRKNNLRQLFDMRVFDMLVGIKRMPGSEEYGYCFMALDALAEKEKISG